MNTPTKITVSRILLIPIMVIMFCLKDVFDLYYVPMVIIFTIASATDFVDGHMARRLNLVTDLGKFLDPIADKILVTTGMLIVFEMGVFPKFFGVITISIILAREFAVAVYRQIAATKGVVMAADVYGKVKTVVTIVAVGVLMLVPIKEVNALAGNIIWWIGIVLFGIATLLTVISGLNYIIKNKKVLQ